MSASLVGSEMCIRDRELPQAAVNNPAVSEWRKRQLEGTATTHRPSWSWTCLLYTSDAADDM
eukprot:12486864-Alexandrium_andersonii.AAC.1